ncbi:MAG: SDR family oxidoreductase, partial [Rhizobiales bacterium]|nr:SDR family oxidoreductase [Hyphomicrobiales bacterium]
MALDGKVAIVTGGARGIGLASAQRLSLDGAMVVIADIDEDAGAHAVEAISKTGEAGFFRCDVGERLDVSNMVRGAVERFGAVDILINNAGIVHAADFLDLAEDDFDRVLKVNLKGSFITGQMVARQMVEQITEGREPGTIVNMSSINAVVAIANHIPYSVSKGGVRQLTNVMALALAPHGIRVNAVGPGSIMTDLLRSVADDEEARNKILSRTPLLRIGEPDEVASIVAFLVSSDA